MFITVVTALGTAFVVVYVKRMIMFFWGTVELFLYLPRNIEDPDYPVVVPLIRYFKHLIVLMFTTLLFLTGPAILYGISVKGLFLVLSTGIYLWVSIKIPSMLGDYLDLVAERIEKEDTSIQKDYLEREKVAAYHIKRLGSAAIGVAFPEVSATGSAIYGAYKAFRSGSPEELATNIGNFKTARNSETSENAYEEFHTPVSTSAEGKTASRGSGHNDTGSIDRFPNQLAEKYPKEFLKSINASGNNSLNRGKFRLALVGLIVAKYDAGVQLPYESVLSEAQEQVKNMSSDDFIIWVSKGSEFLLRFKGERL